MSLAATPCAVEVTDTGCAPRPPPWLWGTPSRGLGGAPWGSNSTPAHNDPDVPPGTGAKRGPWGLPGRPGGVSPAEGPPGTPCPGLARPLPPRPGSVLGAERGRAGTDRGHRHRAAAVGTDRGERIPAAQRGQPGTQGTREVAEHRARPRPRRVRENRARPRTRGVPGTAQSARTVASHRTAGASVPGQAPGPPATSRGAAPPPARAPPCPARTLPGPPRPYVCHRSGWRWCPGRCSAAPAAPSSPAWSCRAARRGAAAAGLGSAAAPGPSAGAAPAPRDDPGSDRLGPARPGPPGAPAPPLPRPGPCAPPAPGGASAAAGTGTRLGAGRSVPGTPDPSAPGGTGCTGTCSVPARSALGGTGPPGLHGG